nr:hypothetical protein [Tanacetum cinerariifolium]
EPFNYKNGCSEWPTYCWKDDGYCNRGNLPGAYIVGNTLYYQDLEWYEALKDSKLKEEALKNKAIMEGIIDKDDESSNKGWRRWDNFENTSRNRKEREYEMELEDEERFEQGALLWPSVEEDGVTRLKKYSELSAAKAIQADCDVKATNIILQGLPPEVYALVSTYKVAKELWERIQMLMQGTSLTKQERECKLYDEFDKFAYRKGETLRDFYLRFSLLLNDMNMYNMKLEQFQVNTKFLNTLPPEWSKFIADVKLVKDLHTTNLTRTPYQHHQPSYHQSQFQQQATSYQSSPYATTYHNPQFVSQGSSSPNLSISYLVNDTSLTVNHTANMASAPQIEYASIAYNPSEFSSPKTGLVVLFFQKGDDPIDAINHMMSFLTSVVASRYPATNNQLRTSSNPRQQATINNGRVIIQPIQGRQNHMSTGSSRLFVSGSGGTSGKQR